jgi:hypothetical protein
MTTCHEQIGQRTGYEQAMSVLLEPAITHLGEAEHPLDETPIECSTLARTLDLVRFFARSTSSFKPRRRQRHLLHRSHPMRANPPRRGLYHDHWPMAFAEVP